IDPLVPVAHRLQLAAVYFEQLLPRFDANFWAQALINLEVGRNAEAAALLQRLLENNPLSGLRPVVETYLRLLRENPDIPEMPDVEALSTPIPDLADMDGAEQNPAEQDPAGPQTTPPPDADRTSRDSANDKAPEPEKDGGAPQPEGAKPDKADPAADKPNSAESPSDDASQDDTGGDKAADAGDRSPQPAAGPADDA